MPRFDFYEIFLGIFTLAGVVTAVWGWIIIAGVKRIQTWPCVEGIIEKSKRGMDHNDLLPEIVFSYTADGQRRACVQEFPDSLTPSKEFTDSYLDKYPAGARVYVYYDPASPDRATLETGYISGDWMVFIWGLAMIVIGIVFLLVGG